MMLKKIAVLALLCLLVWNCKKDMGNSSASDFQVLVIQGTYKATLIWEELKPAPVSGVAYSVFVGDSLVSGTVKERRFNLYSLLANHAYSGRIEAYSGTKKIGESQYSFKTEADQPPRAFQIEELAAGPGAVSLYWTRSDDPENTKVVYDIIINGQLRMSGLNGLSCQVSGLSPNTTYRTVIESRDSAGNVTSTAFSFLTPTVEKSLLVHRFIEFQGIKRDFGYYVPSGCDSANPMPLVIYLHGANGHGWSELETSYFRTVAEREGFILAMPQALSGTFNGETFIQWNAHYIFPWDDVGFLDYLVNYC